MAARAPRPKNFRMDVTAESVAAVHEERSSVRGLSITYEPQHLRFFQGRFAPTAGTRSSRAWRKVEALEPALA